LLLAIGTFFKRTQAEGMSLEDGMLHGIYHPSINMDIKKKVLCAQHELEMHQTQGLTAPDSTE
jgi:hypothetical protein